MSKWRRLHFGKTSFVRDQVHYANEIKNLEEMVKSSCDEDIYFFEEEINNYIDIARSVESGEASTSKIDYEYLAKKVGEIVKDYTKQQLTDMYITFYSEKPLTSFDKRKIALTIYHSIYSMGRTKTLLG